MNTVKKNKRGVYASYCVIFHGGCTNAVKPYAIGIRCPVLCPPGDAHFAPKENGC